MRQFKQINTGDFDLQRVQENAATTFSDITKIAFLDGTFVEASLNNATDTAVEHGLGRVPLGYFSVACNSPGGTVYESNTANNLKSRIILLRATATVNVKLWIF